MRYRFSFGGEHATAKALGVDETTVRRDLNKRAAQAAPKQIEAASQQAISAPDSAQAAPAPFQIPAADSWKRRSARQGKRSGWA